MKIIDLIGQPNCGKSTLAGELFTSLKKQSKNVVFIPEYGAELVYEGNMFLLQDQMHIFIEQLRRLKRLKNTPDVAIMDTSLLLSIVYELKRFEKEPDIKMNPHYIDYILWEYNQLDISTYYLQSNYEYKKEGRYQDEEEAKDVDLRVQDMLSKYPIKHTTLPSAEAFDYILKSLLK